MFVDEEVATRVEIDGKTIIEEEIQTRPEKLPAGILVNDKEKLQAIYKYMDSDAVTTLYATIKAKDDIPGAWVYPECAEITAHLREVVECESCYEWYHTACLGSTENVEASWSCCKCNPTLVVKVVKMAGVFGQADTSPLIGQKKEGVLVGKETRRPAVVRGQIESRRVVLRQGPVRRWPVRRLPRVDEGVALVQLSLLLGDT